MPTAVSPPLVPPRGCTFADPDWSVLARCWHPVAYVEETHRGVPLAVRLLDQAVVLYRAGSAQTLVAAADVCAHRGAPLSLGCVEADALVCPYHGYRYDERGACVHIPAHPDAPIPGRLALRRFATLERHGLVWVNLSVTSADQAPGSPPPFPEHDDPSFQVVRVPPLDWEASAGRQVESFCDVAHFAFVHPTTFAVATPVVPRYEVAATADGVHAVFVSRAGNVSSAEAAQHDWRRVYDLHLPFTARLRVEFPHGGRLAILNASCPVSARRTRVFPVIARDFDQDRPVDELIAFQQKVYAEDQRIVERQNPEDLPIDLDDEVHVRADRTSVEYRRQLARLGLGRGFTA